jgi:hypothetical protein
MAFIRRSERRTVHHYQRNFDLVGVPGGGYGFDCDDRGNILLPEHAASRENLAHCLANDFPDGRKVIDRGVAHYSWSYTEPAVIRCGCGAEVTLYDPFLSTCDRCGADYNGAGQRLTPRSQWGEEDYWSEEDTFGTW